MLPSTNQFLRLLKNQAVLKLEKFYESGILDTAIIEHGLLTVKQAVEVKFAPEVQAIASKTREIDALRLQAERLSLTGFESKEMARRSLR